MEDDGTIAAPARSGATDLVRTAGRTSLMRVPGGINPAEKNKSVHVYVYITSGTVGGRLLF